MDDVDRSEIPAAIVEAYLEKERGTRALLDELEALAVEGRETEVHERLRALAEADEAVFYTVAFSLAEADAFFGDVEAALGVTAADRLRDLAETYPTLAEPVAVVRTEVSEDRKNPVTDTSYSVTYHHGLESPVVSYRPLSGRRELYESRGTPSELLHLAADLVTASTDALEVAMDKDHSVNTEELSELIDRREDLETSLSRLRDDLDDLRRTPVEDT
jgi:hypothetical protein